MAQLKRPGGADSECRRTVLTPGALKLWSEGPRNATEPAQSKASKVGATPQPAGPAKPKDPPPHGTSHQPQKPPDRRNRPAKGRGAREPAAKGKPGPDKTTDGQADGQDRTEDQTDRQTDRTDGRQTEGPTDQRDRHTHRQTHTPTEAHTPTHRHTHTHTPTDGKETDRQQDRRTSETTGTMATTPD